MRDRLANLGRGVDSGHQPLFMCRGLGADGSGEDLEVVGGMT